MSIVGAILGRTFADRKGLSADASNRYLVTGYVLGAATSPVVAAIVTDRMAEQEAEQLRSAVPGLGSVPVTPPATGTAPVPTIQGFRAGDYIGKQFGDVLDGLLKARVSITRVNISSAGRPKGAIVRISRPVAMGPAGGTIWDPFQEDDIFLPGDAIQIHVNVSEPKKQVPLVEGKKSAEAMDDLQSDGFKIEIRDQDVRNFTDKMKSTLADIVTDQFPEAGEEAVQGSTVAIYVIRGPGEGGHAPDSQSAPLAAAKSASSSAKGNG